MSVDDPRAFWQKTDLSTERPEDEDLQLGRNEGYSENRWLILVAVGGSSSSATGLPPTSRVFKKKGVMHQGVRETYYCHLLAYVCVGVSKLLRFPILKAGQLI